MPTSADAIVTSDGSLFELHTGILSAELCIVLSFASRTDDVPDAGYRCHHIKTGDMIVAALPPRSVNRLHHFAYRCRDAEETRAFYEDLLGLPLVHIVQAETVPSVGEKCPFAHIFFELRDGSYLAFFDLGDDVGAEPSPNTPSWVNHLALEMDSVEEVEAARERLLAAGLDVKGVTDHEFINSIYFFDPNGIRLELTVRTRDEAWLAEEASAAHGKLADWTTRKRSALAFQPQAAHG
jgi:glyoxylase I family protein